MQWLVHVHVLTHVHVLVLVRSDDPRIAFYSYKLQLPSKTLCSRRGGGVVGPNYQWVSSPLGAAVNRARALNMTGVSPGDTRIHVHVIDRGPTHTRHVLNKVKAMHAAHVDALVTVQSPSLPLNPYPQPPPPPHTHTPLPPLRMHLNVDGHAG